MDDVNLKQLQADILGFVRRAYPNIDVRVEPWTEDPTRPAVFFTDAKFAALYPAQRYHYLRNLIPEEYYNQHLADAEWFELAPGEKPENLECPDSQLIADITPAVLRVLKRTRFFESLDDVLCPVDASASRQSCYGDYRHARTVLRARGLRDDELFDVFHVLMARGGHCDCEILLNAAEASRLKAEYWKARADEVDPYDPHARTR